MDDREIASRLDKLQRGMDVLLELEGIGFDKEIGDYVELEEESENNDNNNSEKKEEKDGKSRSKFKEEEE